MTDLDMTTDVETADFTDELSDEALDREEGSCLVCGPAVSHFSAGAPAAAQPVADR